MSMIRLTQEQADAHKKRVAEAKKKWNTEIPADLLPKKSTWTAEQAQEFIKCGAIVVAKPKKSATLSQKRDGEAREAGLSLPYPPSVNHYWQRNKNGGMRISKAGLAFRETVGYAYHMMKGFSGDVSLHIVAYPPDKRRRDLDNTLKAIGDALQHAGLIVDDFQIQDLRIIRGPVRAGGEIYVTVTAI